MTDLWPDDIELQSGLRAPMVILREQGAALGKKTNNNIEGEVLDERSIHEPGLFIYGFFLVAPALNDYRYRLLRILHPIDLYPVAVGVDMEIFADLPAEIREKQVKRDERDLVGAIYSSTLATAENRLILAASEDRFEETLKAIFATKKVRRIIGAIMAQVDPLPF